RDRGGPARPGGGAHRRLSAARDPLARPAAGIWPPGAARLRAEPWRRPEQGPDDFLGRHAVRRGPGSVSRLQSPHAAVAHRRLRRSGEDRNRARRHVDPAEYRAVRRHRHEPAPGAPIRRLPQQGPDARRTRAGVGRPGRHHHPAADRPGQDGRRHERAGRQSHAR
ncbi:hypothetical protein OY671_011210, partial [Metschnikowia pulcherrima]